MTFAKQSVGLAISILTAFAAAAIGAVASIRAANFYQLLVRPSWAPPANVFGPVWTVLYLLMGFAAWLVWREQRSTTKEALRLYGSQLGLNALWSWLFFAWHQGQLALFDIIALWFLIVTTAISFWRIRPLAGLLLLPYFLWVSFASLLALQVWRLNPTLLA